MPKLTLAGRLRASARVAGPLGVARVSRLGAGRAERYRVVFVAYASPREAIDLGEVWRYAQPLQAVLDGGWVRALALCEHATRGNAEHYFTRDDA